MQAAIGMAIICVLLLAQAAAQAAAEQAHTGGRGHHRGGRSLAELDDAGEVAWHEGALMLAPTLLQLI